MERRSHFEWFMEFSRSRSVEGEGSEAGAAALTSATGGRPAGVKRVPAGEENRYRPRALAGSPKHPRRQAEDSGTDATPRYNLRSIEIRSCVAADQPDRCAVPAPGAEAPEPPPGADPPEPSFELTLGNVFANTGC
jgi:hypothetical protein